eukprot:TRINITY_DN2215_c0_g1_i1.p2 TRINITY_DN2215_c0_g1~~TRINITY_DN2215_c0_g1_i1.p2  ORF type:complete len:91 (-),score=24.53 TRINITY_DN2215_c0_g1_i1:2-274(-)
MNWPNDVGAKDSFRQCLMDSVEKQGGRWASCPGLDDDKNDGKDQCGRSVSSASLTVGNIKIVQKDDPSTSGKDGYITFGRSSETAKAHRG